MALPDKPLVIDLDTIGLDGWIAFADAARQLQELKGGDLATMHQALVSARDILIALLAASEWTAEEVGKLNLAEMKQVFARIGAGMRGPNAPSGSPSLPPTATAGRSPSKPESAESPRNGRVPRGKLRPSSA